MFLSIFNYLTIFLTLELLLFYRVIFFFYVTMFVSAKIPFNIVKATFQKWHLIHYRYAPLFEVCLPPLRFYESPILILAFAKWNKSKEGFCFYGKKQIVKLAPSACFVASPSLRKQRHPQRWLWPRQAPSAGTTLSISASSSVALNCVCEHLCASFQFTLRICWQEVS